MLLAAQILLTIATLGYSAIPTLVDLGPTHATNPSWTGHARYHVVWQVVSLVLMALLGLFLTWTATGPGIRLWIPAALCVAAYGGFWAALLTRSKYRGVMQDEVNGVPEVGFKVFGWKASIDANVSQFAPLTLIALIAIAIIATLPAEA